MALSSSLSRLSTWGYRRHPASWHFLAAQRPSNAANRPYQWFPRRAVRAAPLADLAPALQPCTVSQHACGTLPRVLNQHACSTPPASVVSMPAAPAQCQTPAAGCPPLQVKSDHGTGHGATHTHRAFLFGAATFGSSVWALGASAQPSDEDDHGAGQQPFECRRSDRQRRPTQRVINADDGDPSYHGSEDDCSLDTTDAGHDGLSDEAAAGSRGRRGKRPNVPAAAGPASKRGKRGAGGSVGSGRGGSRAKAPAAISVMPHKPRRGAAMPRRMAKRHAVAVREDGVEYARARCASVTAHGINTPSCHTVHTHACHVARRMTDEEVRGLMDRRDAARAVDTNVCYDSQWNKYKVGGHPPPLTCPYQHDLFRPPCVSASTASWHAMTCHHCRPLCSTGQRTTSTASRGRTRTRPILGSARVTKTSASCRPGARSSCHGSKMAARAWPERASNRM
jgi:hypothetical protein